LYLLVATKKIPICQETPFNHSHLPRDTRVHCLFRLITMEREMTKLPPAAYTAKSAIPHPHSASQPNQANPAGGLLRRAGPPAGRPLAGPAHRASCLGARLPARAQGLLRHPRPPAAPRSWAASRCAGAGPLAARAWARKPGRVEAGRASIRPSRCPISVISAAIDRRWRPHDSSVTFSRRIKPIFHGFLMGKCSVIFP